MSKRVLFPLLVMTLMAGCSYQERRTGYGYGAPQAEGGQVISSPQYRVAGTAAATTAQPSVYSSGAGPAGGSQGLSQSDAALVNQVREALSRSDTLAPLVPNLNVSAQNGVVTVAGTVPSQQQKEMIDALVAKSVGAANVRDQLQVGGTPTGRPEPSNRVYSTNQVSAGSSGAATTGDIFNLHVQGLNETDRTVAQRILEGLRTDPALASLLPTVNINISGGKVVLQGTVQSEQQKQTIGSVVGRAAGASNVENQLAVSSGPGNAGPSR